MNTSSTGGGRLPPNPDPLAQPRAEGRRVVDSDVNRLRGNDRGLVESAGKTNQRNISSSREFRQQMKVQSRKYGGRVHPQAVKQAASRMTMAGYSEQSIMRGMRHYNSQFSRMSGGEFRSYFNRHIKPALRHPKVQHARNQNIAFKRQHGIPQNYRNMQGLKNINKHVQKQQRQQALARQQKEQQAIAQNRKQGIQHTRSRGRR